MLLKKLIGNSGVYPMHMPGHKRNTGLLGDDLPYGIDITELDGFDNLHDPRGILKETADLAARLYGCEKAYTLINGSTAGILAAIGSLTSRGDTLLLARNCHMSVYNAACLFGLKTAYIVPERDRDFGISCSISPESVKKGLLENPGAKLVVITSPTYEGVVSDISAIAETVHEYGAKLFVDAAHGAHFGFSQKFPQNAVKCGADIAAVSLHKTLPALTQCALMLVRRNSDEYNALPRMLSLLQTSSPSYVLLASIDRCLRLIESDGGRLFSRYENNLERFSRDIEPLVNLSVMCHGSDSPENHPGFYAFDPGKLIIGTHKTAISGTALAGILRSDYNMELEMAYGSYALAMTSLCDTEDGFLRLSEALLEIDAKTEAVAPQEYTNDFALPVQALALKDALSVPAGVFIPLGSAAGSVSLEFVRAYPPGVPIIAPGEIVSRDIISDIIRLCDTGTTVMSTHGKLPHFIRVLHRDS